MSSVTNKLFSLQPTTTENDSLMWFDDIINTVETCKVLLFAISGIQGINSHKN